MRSDVWRDIDSGADAPAGEIDDRNRVPRIRIAAVYAVAVVGNVGRLAVGRNRQLVRRPFDRERGYFLEGLRIEEADHATALVDHDEAVGAGGVIDVSIRSMGRCNEQRDAK